MHTRGETFVGKPCMKHGSAPKRYLKDGKCVECSRRRNKAYRKDHLMEMRAASLAWNKAHPEEARASVARWRKTHPTENGEKSAAWRRECPEKVRAGRAKYRAKYRARGMLRDAQKRAQKRGFLCSLTEEQNSSKNSRDASLLNRCLRRCYAPQ